MDLTSLIIFLAVGAFSGWAASQIMRGGGFGLVMNIVLGIIGSIVGDWVFGMLNLSVGSGLVGTIITSISGAVVVLFIVSFFKK